MGLWSIMQAFSGNQDFFYQIKTLVEHPLGVRMMCQSKLDRKMGYGQAGQGEKQLQEPQIQVPVWWYARDWEKKVKITIIWRKQVLVFNLVILNSNNNKS